MKTTADWIGEEYMQNMLLKQLTIRFGDLPDEIMERVRAAEHPQLEQWAERLITVESLEQVFAE